jgi:hypothetical protein
MDKNRIFAVPLLIGLLLICYAWYTSFPIFINSANDYIYNHISVYYWIGLSLSFASAFLISYTSKREYIKWVMVVCFIISLYSIWFFYFTLPTSDATFFRGVTQNFLNTGSLDITQSYLSYYQWPAFFIIAEIVTSVTGLSLVAYEFVLLIIIELLTATALYIYASKLFKGGGFIAVITFFCISYNFINFQAVPFTLAFALLCLLFTLDIQNTHNQNKRGLTVLIILVYVCIALTHLFVPLFFVIYLLIRTFFDKSYLKLFAITLQIYFIIQVTFGSFSFGANISQVFLLSSEFSSIVANTFTPVTVPIDVISQIFTRAIVAVFALITFTGFLYIFFRKKIRQVDKSILITGIVYTCFGAIVFTLGTRAIPLIVIPISIGSAFLIKSRFSKPLICIVLFMMILLVFVPFHSSFNNYPITYQTKEDLTAANFILDKYNWQSDRTIISDSGIKWYLSPQIRHEERIDTIFENRYGLANITKYDCIIYSLGLEQSFVFNNISPTNISNQISQKYDILYNSGSFCFAIS